MPCTACFCVTIQMKSHRLLVLPDSESFEQCNTAIIVAMKPLSMRSKKCAQIVVHIFTNAQMSSNKMVPKKPLVTKLTTPCERVLKTVPETGVFFVYHFV